MTLAFSQTETLPDPPPVVKPQALAEVFLAVSLNQEDLHETVLMLRQGDGRVFGAARDFQRWRLRVPALPPLTYRDNAYYALDALPGLAYRIDERTQEIALEARADLFQETTFSGRSGSPNPVASSFGAFLNYDAFAQHVSGRSRVDALAELGTFNPWGVGTLNLRGQDLAGASHLTRLDTTWTSDMPSRMASLRLGDGISRAVDWGGAVRFGGIQWATNFATQSRFISFPLPSLAGESALPSTLDLYVNNALRLRRDVPAGPFSVTDLPVMTGLGETRLVVKDLLGREQVITQPYYVAPRLLSRGLHDYSYEVGLLRKDFGFKSFAYGPYFAEGTHRLGFTDQFTGEVHGEWLRRQQTLGVNGTALWPELGVFNVSVAGSRRDSAVGGLVGFGFERQAKWLGISGRTQFASKHFAQIGLEPARLSPRQISQVFVSLSAADYGSLNLGYTHLDNRDRADLSVFSAGYNVALGSLGYLTLAYFRTLSGESNSTIALTFTRALGERTSMSVGGTLQQYGDRSTLQVQQNLPRGSGFGYRLLAAGGSNDQLEAGVSAQNAVGLYTADVSRFGGQTAFRGSISGGVAFLGSRPFFARRLSNSFALVQVPGLSDVRIYADNQLVGRTDSAGEALIPQLRAYDRNVIRIEQADLPLDVQLDAVELDAVPYFRSGYLLKFPARRSRGALFRLQLETGEPMPAGAMVRVLGQAGEFPVALRGEVYVTGLAQRNRLRATWRGQSCEFGLGLPDSKDPLPDVGRITCRGVRP